MPEQNLTLRLRVYLAVFIAVMLLGTFGTMLAEGLSFGDAVYFTIVTIATVGYGDISPATSLGKWLAIVLIVTGVGTFVGVVANATEIFLDRRERQARVAKLNMVIGLFFSEAGNRLLRFCAEADDHRDEKGRGLVIGSDWTAADFNGARNRLQTVSFKVDPKKIDVSALRIFFEKQGNLLVRLMESPYMLEHESFTDLLIATLHLKEELSHREGLEGLPPSDYEHLAGDVNRVYGLLVRQWLDYMEHLKSDYPFLFSLAMRTNPFDAAATPVVL